MLKFYFTILLLILTNCSNDRNKNIIEANNPIIKYDNIINQESAQSNDNNEAYISDDSKFCYFSCPEIDTKNNIKIDNDDFLLSYNKETKYADWVAYKINKNILLGSPKKRIWQEDLKIPAEVRMIPADYTNAYEIHNYDKGHQAPLADFSNGNNWEKANYLSNITPQKSPLNQGSWNDLEVKIRLIGKEHPGEMYIITGTYYNNKPMPQLPKARIANIIPNGYWKIITLVKDDNIYRASFKFEQETPKNAKFCNYQTTIKDLNQIVTYSLNIPEDTENSKELLKILGCNNLSNRASTINLPINPELQH